MNLKVVLGRVNKFLNWVKTLVSLMRARNVFISFFGVIVGALVFSLGAPIGLWPIFAAAVSAALILGAGNAINDYFDFEIDKINKPGRPIPSGRISRSDTFIFALALFLVGVGFAKSINEICLGIAFFNTVILFGYARYSKRLHVFSNIMISYLVASVFIYGAAAAYTPGFTVNDDGVKLLVVLAACAFFINLSREIVKDIEDVEGDSKAYAKTLAISHGVDSARKVAFVVALFAVILSYYPVLSSTIGFNELLYGIVITLTNGLILSSFSFHPALNQRILIVGMVLALAAFVLGVTPTYINI